MLTQCRPNGVAQSEVCGHSPPVQRTEPWALVEWQLPAEYGVTAHKKGRPQPDDGRGHFLTEPSSPTHHFSLRAAHFLLPLSHSPTFRLSQFHHSHNCRHRVPPPSLLACDPSTWSPLHSPPTSHWTLPASPSCSPTIRRALKTTLSTPRLVAKRPPRHIHACKMMKRVPIGQLLFLRPSGPFTFAFVNVSQALIDDLCVRDVPCVLYCQADP